jgi:hypothetical protein
MLSSGMWHYVDLGLIDVSEERIASIFTVGKSASKEPASAGGCRLQPFGLRCLEFHHLFTLDPIIIQIWPVSFHVIVFEHSFSSNGMCAASIHSNLYSRWLKFWYCL